MNAPSNHAAVASIQAVLDHWRALGSKKLRSGAELITRVPDADTYAWLHVLYPRLDDDLVAQLEAEVGRALPADLRSLYGFAGGMTLFGGAFDVHCLRPAYVREGDFALQPKDLVQLNHELELLGWKPVRALPFAVNAWDMSIYLFGMTASESLVSRCDRRTGKVLEQHDDVFEALAAKLLRLDDLMIV